METKKAKNPERYEGYNQSPMVFENIGSGKDGLIYEIILRVFDFLEKDKPSITREDS
jgi:hypothetical protein